jgi:endoglucanase
MEIKSVFRNTGLAGLAILIPILALHGFDLKRSEQGTLECHGLTVLLFHNAYHSVFGDQKMSGVETILQEQRIATNGDVRLSPTPEQWDPIPEFKQPKHGPGENELTAYYT